MQRFLTVTFCFWFFAFHLSVGKANDSPPLSVRPPQSDLWQPGAVDSDWREVERLQRYPLYDKELPDLERLVSHPNVQVRVALCLFLSRQPFDDNHSLLIPLLKDENEIVVNAAFAAMISPPDKPNRIRVHHPELTSLLRGMVLDSRLDFEHRRSESPWLSILFEHSQLFGVEADLLRQSLDKRKQWFNQHEDWRVQGQPRLSTDVASRGIAIGTTEVCLAHSEVDYGKSIEVSIGTNSASVENALRSAQVGTQVQAHRLRSLGRRARMRFPTKHDGENLRVIIETDAHQRVFSGEFAVGVYVLEVAGSPFLIRCRRSPEMEKERVRIASGLLQSAAVSEADIPKCGTLKVAESIPVLTKQFVRDAGGDNFDVAAAFLDLGDPTVIPVLLRYPEMCASFGGCGRAGTTEYVLHSLGEPTYRACRQRIQDWRQLVDEGRQDELRYCLEILLGRINDEDREALLEMLHWVCHAFMKDQPKKQQDENLRLLIQLRQVLVSTDLTHFADAIW